MKNFSDTTTKLFCSLTIFCWAMLCQAQPCRIDQTAVNGFALVTTETAVGQTFTACETGVITQIRVSFGEMNTQELRLQISSGSNTLNPQYTQVVNTKGKTGDLLVMLTTPFPVQAQQKYAFTMIGISGTGTLATMLGFNGNPYPGGNLITEKNASVTNFATDCDFSLVTVEKACAIDQPQVNGFALITTETAVGQTFKACGSGLITHIRASFGVMSTQELRLQISSGGNTLSPQYTQVVKTDGTGDLLIQLTTPFPVQDQQQYAFTMIGISGAGTLATMLGFNGNPYPSGNLITESNGSVNNFGTDGDFSVYITEDACLVDQPTDNAFALINTETAVGQNFTACGSGWITHVRVKFGEMNTQELRLQISDGPNTLNPGYTQVVKTNGSGDLLIPLTTAFPVQDMQQYAFTLTGISGAGTLATILSANGNPYSGGNRINESNGSVTNFSSDANFSIVILRPENVSSISEIVSDSPALTAFPNPATDRLVVQLETGEPVLACWLTDLTGKTVTGIRRVADASPQTELNLTALPRGMYILQVQAGEQRYSKKVVVQ